jgi:lipopolysaccharide transport system permease protein
MESLTVGFLMLTIFLRNFSETYRYRALLLALTRRYLSMRYRGSALGFLWSLLNPLCLMGVYTLVFRYYIRFSEESNYAIVLFCGLLPWMWVTSALSEAASSIVTSGHLVTKSAFPAHILPTVAVSTNMIHFLFALPVLILFLVVAGLPIRASWASVPLLIGLNFFFLHGIAVGLSALNVFFRDVQHVVGNVLSLLFFLCPIVYPLSAIPLEHHFTFKLNPFSSFIIGYQNAIMEGVFASWGQLFYLLCWGVLTNLLGNYIYNHYSENFAEML